MGDACSKEAPPPPPPKNPPIRPPVQAAPPDDSPTNTSTAATQKASTKAEPEESSIPPVGEPSPTSSAFPNKRQSAFGGVSRRSSIASLREGIRASRRASSLSQASSEHPPTPEQQVVEEESELSRCQRKAQGLKRWTYLMDPSFSYAGSMLPDLPDIEVTQEDKEWMDLWETLRETHLLKSLTDARELADSLVSLVREMEKPREVKLAADICLAAVCHDLGDVAAALEVLEIYLRDPSSSDVRQLSHTTLWYISHYNHALMLKDQRDKGWLFTAESYSRTAAEGFKQLHGDIDVGYLVSLVLLAEVIMEQARFVEASLIADLAQRGFVKRYGKESSEVSSVDEQLEDIFMHKNEFVSQSRANGMSSYVLLEKEPDQLMGARWKQVCDKKRVVLIGITDGPARSSGFDGELGKILTSVNGVEINHVEDLQELLKGATFLVFQFDKVPATTSWLVNTFELTTIEEYKSVYSPDSMHHSKGLLSKTNPGRGRHGAR